jgi:hypothetical protein
MTLRPFPDDLLLTTPDDGSYLEVFLAAACKLSIDWLANFASGSTSEFALRNTNVVPLFPRAIRSRSLRYVLSIQPLASSPRSLKGTGYGTVNLVPLISSRASWKEKSMRSSGDRGGSLLLMPKGANPNIRPSPFLGSTNGSFEVDAIAVTRRREDLPTQTLHISEEQSMSE